MFSARQHRSRSGTEERARSLALGLLLSVVFSSSAQAQEEYADLPVLLELASRTVVSSFDVRSALTEEFRDRIKDGLAQKVRIEVTLYDADDDEIAHRTRRCEFKWDLWVDNDPLTVTIIEGTRERRRRFGLIDNGLAYCGNTRRLSLSDRSLMRRSYGYRLVVKVSLNPVSERDKREAREFMSNPRGSPAKPRGFFDAVADFFSSSSDVSGDVFYFRSSRLWRPEEESP